MICEIYLTSLLSHRLFKKSSKHISDIVFFYLQKKSKDKYLFLKKKYSIEYMMLYKCLFQTLNTFQKTKISI